MEKPKEHFTTEGDFSPVAAATQKPTAGSIASFLGCELQGNAGLIIQSIKPLSEAQPSDLSFFAPTSKKSRGDMEAQLATTKAGAVIVPKAVPNLSCAQLIVANPLEALIKVAFAFFAKASQHEGIHPKAEVHPTATLGKGVSIGANAVIGAFVSIGDGSIIYPNAVIYPGAQIGAKCIIHSGAVIRENVVLKNDCLILNNAVIGADGFGYIPDKEIYNRRIPHVGTVVLEQGVDIGACSTVDRATYGTTRIDTYTKLDNLVMVGHNCDIGKGSLFCSQVGVSGSCTIGDKVTLAGKVGVADHVTIGSNVRAAAKSGLINDIGSNIDVAGYPPMPVNEWRRTQVMLRKLPELFKKLRVAAEDSEK